MPSFLEDLALKALGSTIGNSAINSILINKLVGAGRTRPHPWSTKHDYISWSGLTDRTYNARLLPAHPYPSTLQLGSRMPPLEDVSKLFPSESGKQVRDRKSTALFPAFAQYLTDGFIRTHVFNSPQSEDRKRTTSNHEIDLSPLYGRTPAQTAVLRVSNPPQGQKGQLKTDLSAQGHVMPPKLYDDAGNPKTEFCDAAGKLILDEPLGINTGDDKSTLFAFGGDRANANVQVAMINLLFLREHNRLAALLEQKNPTWDDERTFETARNIVIVQFIKIVVEEYINHINTSVFKLLAEPDVAWDADWNRPNWMTVEFSLLYRWHSLVPETMEWQGATIATPVLLRNNSRLMNSGLSDCFVEISNNAAGKMGLGNAPFFLAQVEEKALAQARTNNVDTYNAYRKAMNLDPARDFKDLVGKSSDPVESAKRKALAAELERLYGSIDNVEFYVGLFAEEPNENGPLPDLVMAMVAMDAFSQALTNPLLSRHVWGDPAIRLQAFTEIGLETIQGTRRLRDVLSRNTHNLGDRFVGMTQRDWIRS